MENRETYTDAIMVQNAIERLPDKNAYEHAMWMYHYDLEEDVWTPEDSLKAFVNLMRMSITCTFIFMRGTGTAIFYT